MSVPAGERLRWDVDGRDWPHREASRFVRAAGLTWHVQTLGAGPLVLLLHGTGASTHTWRDVMAPLARHYRVLGVDLPGHAFTEPLPAAQSGLPGMTAALRALLAATGTPPVAVIGHSAGAAIGARLCLDAAVKPSVLVSLNGALLPVHGMPMGMFSTLARLCAATSLVPRLVAWRAADAASLRRLVASTGSALDARGLELYGRLVRNPAHVAAVLSMMAAWDLAPLVRDLPQLTVPLELLASGGDRTVPPSEAARVRALVPGAPVVRIERLGHLAHEEAPERLVAQLLTLLARHAAPAATGP